MQLGLLFFSLKMSLTCMLLRRWLVARKWSSLVKLAVLSANFSAVSHMVCSSSSREHVTGNVLCKPSALLHTGHVHSAKGRIQFGSCSSKIVGDRYNTVHTGVVRAADPQLCSQYNTLPSFLGFPSVINHTAKTLVQSVCPDKVLLAGVWLLPIPSSFWSHSELWSWIIALLLLSGASQ